jgi:hypothetical protein
MFFTYHAFGATVSVNSDCNNGDIPYNFDNSLYRQDFKIVFSSNLSETDYTVKVLMSKDDADIVVEDNANANANAIASAEI